MELFTFDNIIEAAGFLVGLAYLYFEYHANRLVWLMSVIMPLISIWVYLNAGLYADFAINIYYFLIAIYGYTAWTFGHNRKQSTPLPISRITPKALLGSLIAFVVIFMLIYFVLQNYTNSTVPAGDAFTTALSIVAMWMLARKYIEQWIAWMIVDAMCVCLYIYKGIYLYGVLYAIYTIIALLGYRKWQKLMAGQAN